MKLIFFTAILIALVGCNAKPVDTVTDNVQKSVKVQVGEPSIYQFGDGDKPGHTLEVEGFYIVYCRDGVVWKSAVKTANTHTNMLWIHDDMLDMTTLEDKRILIPIANIHHIEFITDLVKKEEV